MILWISQKLLTLLVVWQQTANNTKEFCTFYCIDCNNSVSIPFISALGNLGSVLSSQGRFEEARIALLEALKHRPNMADVHYNL